MKWCGECWTLFYSLIGNWLKYHTSWVLSGIGMKIKSFPNTSNLLVLNFTAPRYAFYSLFYNLRLHVIFNEWSRSVFVASVMCFVYDTKPDIPTQHSSPSYLIRIVFSICLRCLPYLLLILFLKTHKENPP